MRQLKNACLGLLALVALPSFAFAQASCPISMTSPKSVSATTYTLAAADACGMLVFTAGGASTVTMPNAATTLPPGFRVFIKSQGAGGVTLNTPTVSTIDGAVGTVAITQGKGVEVRADGTNYFTTGIGVIHP